MTYSQKYTIVQFLESVDEGFEYDMREWPLHTTIVDVFAVEMTPEFTKQLTSLIHSIKSFEVSAGDDSQLGSTKVILMYKSEELQSLHEKLIHFLEAQGAIFNTPQYNYDGFLPHSTIQGTDRIYKNDAVKIQSLSIIDMFPGGEWQQRKVLKTIKLA